MAMEPRNHSWPSNSSDRCQEPLPDTIATVDELQGSHAGWRWRGGMGSSSFMGGACLPPYFPFFAALSFPRYAVMLWHDLFNAF